MNPTALMSRTCTITHRTTGTDRDEYNNPVPSETTTTVLGELQQSTGSERTVDADLQRGEWVLFLVPDAVIDGGDVVTIDGDEYEVNGPPWACRHPRTGELTHIEARLFRTV